MKEILRVYYKNVYVFLIVLIVAAFMMYAVEYISKSPEERTQIYFTSQELELREFKQRKLQEINDELKQSEEAVSNIKESIKQLQDTQD